MERGGFSLPPGGQGEEEGVVQGLVADDMLPHVGLIIGSAAGGAVQLPCHIHAAVHALRAVIAVDGHSQVVAGTVGGQRDAAGPFHAAGAADIVRLQVVGVEGTQGQRLAPAQQPHRVDAVHGLRDTQVTQVAGQRVADGPQAAVQRIGGMHAEFYDLGGHVRVRRPYFRQRRGLPAPQVAGDLRRRGHGLRPHLPGGGVRGKEIDLQRVGGKRLPEIHPQAAAVDAEAVAVGTGLAVEEGIRVAVEHVFRFAAPQAVGLLRKERLPGGGDLRHGGGAGTLDAAGLQTVVVRGEHGGLIQPLAVLRPLPQGVQRTQQQGRALHFVRGRRRHKGALLPMDAQRHGAAFRLQQTHLHRRTAFILFDHLIPAIGQHRVRQRRHRDLNEHGAEGRQRDLHAFAPAEHAQVRLIGVTEIHLKNRAIAQPHGIVQRDRNSARFPGVVAGADQPLVPVAPGDGVGAEGLRQQLAVDQQRRVLPVIVIHPRQLGKFVVPQKPGVPVHLRRQDQAAGKGLIEQVVLKVIQRGGQAHAVVLRQAGQPLYVAAGKQIGPVVHGRDLVVGEHVRIGLLPVPQKGGDVGLRLVQVQPVVQHDQVRRVLAALPQHLGKEGGLFRPQLAADPVQLELGEVMVPAQVDEEIKALLFRLRVVPEAVRRAPQAHADPDGLRRLYHVVVLLRVLGLELCAFQVPIALAGAVKVARVPGVDADLHPVGLLHPAEEIQVDQRLALRGALVGVVDPGKILGHGRGFVVRAGVSGVFSHGAFLSICGIFPPR